MPTAIISFQVDLEIDYDPFKGKTLEEYADIVQEDLEDCLWDVREGELEGFFTTKMHAAIKD